MKLFDILIDSYVCRTIKRDITKSLMKMLKCSKFQINPHSQNSSRPDISDPIGYFHRVTQAWHGSEIRYIQPHQIVSSGYKDVARIPDWTYLALIKCIRPLKYI
jgi:hypothetical protein